MALKKPKKITIFLRYFLTISILIIIALLFFDFSKKRKASISYTPPSTTVIITKPEKHTIRQSITLSGHVEASAMIPVIPLVNGTITEYSVKAGKYVTEGQILARIDDSPYTQQKLQAQAAYLGYESTFNRVEGLYKSGAATRQEYDSVKAQKDAAKAQLDLALLQLSYATVKSPVSGTVLSAPQAKGSIGNTQQPIAIISDLENQVVRLAIPEKYFDLFNEKEKTLLAKVTRPGMEGFSEPAQCDAKLETITPYIQAESKTFLAVLKLLPSKRDQKNIRVSTLFRPGMYVTVTIIYREFIDVPSLSQKVLKTDGSCYIYDIDSKKAQWISFKPIAQDDNLFIIPEEYANEYFIIDGQNLVFDGQTVKAQTESGDTL